MDGHKQPIVVFVMQKWNIMAKHIAIYHMDIFDVEK
jgi:hypothetical protein